MPDSICKADSAFEQRLKTSLPSRKLQLGQPRASDTLRLVWFKEHFRNQVSYIKYTFDAPIKNQGILYLCPTVTTPRWLEAPAAPLRRVTGPCSLFFRPHASESFLPCVDALISAAPASFTGCADLRHLRVIV